MFLSHPLMLCWACSSGKSLHPRSTCRSLAFCVRRCGPTKCLTFSYRSYKPQVVMEIHWVAVAAKLQWREEQAKGGGQLARPLLWARTKGVCWLQAKSRTDYSSNMEKPGASLGTATLQWGQNTWVKDLRFMWLYWLCWTIQKKPEWSSPEYTLNSSSAPKKGASTLIQWLHVMIIACVLDINIYMHILISWGQQPKDYMMSLSYGSASVSNTSMSVHGDGVTHVYLAVLISDQKYLGNEQLVWTAVDHYTIN